MHTRIQLQCILKNEKEKDIGEIERFSFRKTHSRLIGIEQFRGGNSGSRRITLRSRREEKGWNTAFQKAGILVPLPEKVVGWACSVAISAGVTSRTEASNDGPGITNRQRAGEKKLDDASRVPSYRRF